MIASIRHRDESYRHLLGALGDRQKAVLQAIAKHPFGITNAEIAKELGVAINQITGRTFELRERGLVESFGSKIDAETGRKVTAWAIKDAFIEWLKIGGGKA